MTRLSYFPRASSTTGIAHPDEAALLRDYVDRDLEAVCVKRGHRTIVTPELLAAAAGWEVALESSARADPVSSMRERAGELELDDEAYMETVLEACRLPSDRFDAEATEP